MAKASNQSVIITDGSNSFEGGVDSLAVPTIQSADNPNGLARNELAWLNNGVVRDGGITQRTGWQPLVTLADSSKLFQGKYVYEPDFADPYFIYLISGHVIKVQVPAVPGGGPITVTDLSVAFNLFMPPTQPKAFFVQAEQFLVIQAGDNLTLPLFWDGAILRRSKGITNPAVAPGTPGVNEIPAATMMDYHDDRLWYAQGRNANAGDIIYGGSGTLAYKFRDAVLNVTENPLVVGGDGFSVPAKDGVISALTHPANLDTSLGQGPLFVCTNKAIHALTVPITRADWIAADKNNRPLMTVVQKGNGAVSDRSVVSVNGDLFFQSLEPSIRSFIMGLRYFQQWANVPISANENRILAFNDRSLLKMSSGILFDNRLLQTALPKQLPQGVVHQALIPLDFQPISSFGVQLNPIWEGMYQGLQFLQLATADFGGLERAFGTIVSENDSSIQLWELTDDQRFENGDNRVTWQIEFPAFTWGDSFNLKKLVSAELWIDKLFGEVIFTMDYRPDSDPCWFPWFTWKECAARTSCETVEAPVCYPIQNFRESFRSTKTLPLPPDACESITGRPANVAYQIQPRLTITGWCRVRGLRLHAEWVQKQLYSDMVCV